MRVVQLCSQYVRYHHANIEVSEICRCDELLIMCGVLCTKRQWCSFLRCFAKRAATRAHGTTSTVAAIHTSSAHCAWHDHYREALGCSRREEIARSSNNNSDRTLLTGADRAAHLCFLPPTRLRLRYNVNSSEAETYLNRSVIFNLTGTHPLRPRPSSNPNHQPVRGCFTVPSGPSIIPVCFKSITPGLIRRH